MALYGLKLQGPYCRDPPFEMGSFSFKSVNPRNGTIGKDDVQVRNRRVVRLVECVVFQFLRPSIFSSICNVVFRRCANQSPEILHCVFLYIFSLIGGFQNLR